MQGSSHSTVCYAIIIVWPVFCIAAPVFSGWIWAARKSIWKIKFWLQNRYSRVCLYVPPRVPNHGLNEQPRKKTKKKKKIHACTRKIKKNIKKYNNSQLIDQKTKYTDTSIYKHTKSMSKKTRILVKFLENGLRMTKASVFTLCLMCDMSH